MKLLQFIKNLCLQQWDEHIKIYQTKRFNDEWDEFMKHQYAWNI